MIVTDLIACEDGLVTCVLKLLNKLRKVRKNCIFFICQLACEYKFMLSRTYMQYSVVLVSLGSKRTKVSPPHFVSKM